MIAPRWDGYGPHARSISLKGGFFSSFVSDGYSQRDPACLSSSPSWALPYPECYSSRLTHSFGCYRVYLTPFFVYVRAFFPDLIASHLAS
jgi:hypothetical protein